MLCIVVIVVLILVVEIVSGGWNCMVFVLVGNIIIVCCYSWWINLLWLVVVGRLNVYISLWLCGLRIIVGKFVVSLLSWVCRYLLCCIVCLNRFLVLMIFKMWWVCIMLVRLLFYVELSCDGIVNILLVILFIC